MTVASQSEKDCYWDLLLAFPTKFDAVSVNLRSRWRT